MSAARSSIDLQEANESAGEVLDYILSEESVETKEAKENLVKVEDALKAQRILDRQSERALARVLFVTDDLQMLIDGSAAQQHYHNLATLFDEIHIMVVLIGDKPDHVFRLAKNIWVYKFYDDRSFFKSYRAKSFAKKHFIFNDIVRPDVVVSTNPFAVGAIGRAVAHALDRPFQVHISFDIYDEQWLKQGKDRVKKAKQAKQLLKHDDVSVRVGNGIIRAKTQKYFPHIASLDVLPHRYNLAAFQNPVRTIDIHNRYQDFVFIMATHGPFTADSPLHDVFAATRGLLLNPRIGLVVIGSGPAKELFRQKVKLLGIERSVVFVDEHDDLVPIYQTCDVFIEAGSSEESEVHILRAIGAGAPVVTVHSPLRDDLFDNEQGAFLCAEKDIPCLTKGVSQLMNSNTLRQQFRSAVKDISENRIHEDAASYYKALRYHIESVFADGEADVEDAAS